MRFIHCADLHLDSPLRGLEQYEGAPAQEMREATIEALGVAIPGQSFATGAVTEDLAAAYPEVIPRILNIGLLNRIHIFLN